MASVILSEVYANTEEIVLGHYCGENQPPERPIDTNLNKATVEIWGSFENSGLVVMVEYEALQYKRSSELGASNEMGNYNISKQIECN